MKHLPDLFEKWNRKRGTGSKLSAYAVFIIMFVVLYTLVHPWQFPINQTSVISYTTVVGGFIIAVLIMFQWFWFSDRWPHTRLTHKEQKRPLMDAYANWKMDSAVEYNIIQGTYSEWKFHSLAAGWMVKCGLSLGLVGLIGGYYSWWLIGTLLGNKIATSYYNHFRPELANSIEKAEKASGRWLGWAYYLLMIEPLIKAIRGYYG